MNSSKRYHAITLVEMLVTLAIILIVATLTIGVSINQLSRGSQRDDTNLVYSSIALAQQNSISQLGDSGYGVLIEAHQITTFMGDDLATSPESSTLILSDTSTLSVSGANPIIFDPGQTAPRAISTVTVTGDVSGLDIVINSYGMIDIIQ